MRGWTCWIGTPRALAQRLAFATAVGVFMGVIGPFGSYGVPFSVRLIAWTVSVWLGSFAVAVALNAAEALCGHADIPAWFARPAALAAAAVPIAATAALVFTALSPHPPELSPFDWYLQTFAIVTPTALGYMLVAGLAQRAQAAPIAATESVSSPRPEPRDGARPFKGDVLALEMEDHYVRVHRLGRSELALMPMAQAVSALSDTPGLRVHRSWWVARDAVEGHALEGRNLRLRLRGGLEAPVARASIAEVRAAGWLDVPAG